MANLLEALAPAWDITLLAPAGPVPLCVAEAVGVSLPQASTVPWRYDASPLGEALDRMLARRRFDRALMFAGAEALGFRRRDLPPAVADLIDCNALEVWREVRTTPNWRARLYWLRELIISTRYARRGFRAFAATTCVGEMDAKWLRRMGGRRVHVVPNGVALPESAPPEAEQPVLSFTGTLDYHPNVDAALFAARAVFPLVRAALPEARLLIAGRRRCRRCESWRRCRGWRCSRMSRTCARCWPAPALAWRRCGPGRESRTRCWRRGPARGRL
ncbi:MAG: hypothetical protein JOY63_12675 [Acetobacteraceae bacterium]|nr:hypothetical protein [Acetobacteraceae bacterium]